MTQQPGANAPGLLDKLSRSAGLGCNPNKQLFLRATAREKSASVKTLALLAGLMHDVAMRFLGGLAFWQTSRYRAYGRGDQGLKNEYMRRGRMYGIYNYGDGGRLRPPSAFERG
jgi:hypothetical protein